MQSLERYIVIKMADQLNGDRIGLADVSSDYRPAELHRLNYWGTIKDQLGNVGIDIGEIKSVDVEPVKRGLFSNRLWYCVHFNDQDGSRKGSVFVKVHHPLRPMDNLENQVAHLMFWHSCKFPTPRFIDYFQAVDHISDRNYKTAALVMEHFKAWTLDKYLLTINILLSRWGGEGDNFIPPEKVLQAEQLKKLRLDLIGNALDILADFAIVGTATLKKEELNPLLNQQSRESEEHFIEKGEQAAARALCWSHIQARIINRSDLNQVFTAPDNLPENLMDIRNTIAKCNKSLKPALHDIFQFMLSSRVYSQGDPEPHNFYARRANGNVGVSIFDSSHAGWGSVEEVLARFLTNPFLGITPKEGIELFLKKQQEIYDRADREQLDIGPRQEDSVALKSFGFLSAYALLRRIGRFASHDLGKNWEYWKNFASQNLEYQPLGVSCLDMPFKDRALLEDLNVNKIPMECYKTELVIPILRIGLEKILTGLVDEPSITEEEKRAVESIFNIAMYMNPANLFGHNNGPTLNSQEKQIDPVRDVLPQHRHDSFLTAKKDLFQPKVLE